jgi:hypothetical protein
VPAGWPADVAPNQIITAAHINAIRSSVYAWPGDVDGQGHTLSNVHLAGATGVLTDPTTTAGDILARDGAALGRFGVGAAGQVLTVDAAAPAKLRWVTPAAAPVASVFGRLGAVVAQAGDYTAAQVTGALVDSLTTKGDIFVRSASATGRFPAGLAGQILRADASQPFGMYWDSERVASVFGRFGGIAAQAGDYTAAQVTNAVSVLGSYPDPSWITSFSWAKLLGVPATFPAAAHTHDAAAIVSGVLSTARLGTGVASASVYLRGDGTWAAAGTGSGGGVISVFGRAGTVIAQGGDYTAAQVTGAVVDPTVIKGDLMVRNDLNVMARLPLGASGQVLQADTSLSVGMKWTTLGAAVQTPWVTNVDAAGYQLANVARVGVAMVPGYPLDVTGDINYSGTLRKNGAPVSFGGSQTPWTTNIDAAGFLLNNAGAIGIGGMASSAKIGVHAGALSTTAGAGVILQSALAQTLNGDEFSTALWRASDGTQWDSALWRIQRTVDGSDIEHIDFGTRRLGFSVLGVERCAINATGFGVGAASPTANIEIADTLASDTPGAAHKLRFSWATTPIFGWRIAAGNAVMALDALGAGWYQAIAFHRQTQRVGINTVDPQGNLGIIATTNPANVATATQLTLGETTNSIGYYLSVGYMTLGGWKGSIQALAGGAAAPLVLNGNGGAVGVGRVAPAYALDVAGDINCTGVFRQGGAPLSFAPAVHTHDAGAIVSGVLATARLGAGTANSSVFLRGDGQWAAPAGGGGGGVTTQSVATGAAVNVPYHNTTGKALFVQVSVSGQGNCNAYTDAATLPSTMVAGVSAGSGQILTMSFWVLAGNYYEVIPQSGTWTVTKWTEWY